MYLGLQIRFQLAVKTLVLRYKSGILLTIWVECKFKRIYGLICQSQEAFEKCPARIHTSCPNPNINQEKVKTIDVRGKDESSLVCGNMERSLL